VRPILAEDGDAIRAALARRRLRRHRRVGERLRPEDVIEEIERRAGICQLPIVLHRNGSAKDRGRWQLPHRAFAIRESDSLETTLAQAAFLLHRSPAVMSNREREAVEAVHGAHLALHGKKALLVDDDMRNIFALATVLDNEGMDHRLGRQRPRGDPPGRVRPEHRHRPDGHHDAGDGRHRDDAGDQEAAARPRAADGRRHRQGDEGRPAEVHRGRRLGLPLQAGRSDEPARSPQGLAVPLNSEFDDLGEDDGERASILIVDDLPEKLLVFQTVLEDLGHELVCARSGAQALKEILKTEFAAILLDVNMPDIDGFETAKLIRQYKRSARTPIIFVTSYADEMQTSLGYSLGAVDYILSPVNPDVLRSKVKVFVDLHLTQRRLRRRANERVALAAAEAARHVAEENTRRSHFFSHASRELGSSLDSEVTGTRLLEMLVPRFASEATLALCDPAGGFDLVLDGRLSAEGEPCVRRREVEQLPPPRWRC
jgi:CheY-like chemotaxis protein